jgi:hypothetical protein
MANDLEFDDLLEDDVEQSEGAPLSIADEEVEDLDDLLGVTDSEDGEIHDELPSVKDDESSSSNVNAIDRFLRDRGIADPTKLKYENEYGHLEDVNFYELPADEQLSILNGFADETNLTEEESSVVNYMRQNNVSFQQILDNYANQQIQAYAAQNNNNVREYAIDEYDDDELFVADLKIKYPNFTDDELLDKLDTAKVNEELYSKEVSQLREYYKGLEDAQLAEQEMIRQSEMQAFENNVADVLDRFNAIPLDPSDVNCDALAIEEADKDRIAQYLFATDVNGQSQLVKDLSDPAALVELAFFRTQKDLLTNMANYWKNVLKDERKQNAKLKKELESYKSKESTVVIKETPKQNKNTIASLWDSVKY